MKNLILIFLVLGFNTFCYSSNDNLPVEDNSIEKLVVHNSSIINHKIENCDFWTRSIIAEKSDLLKDCEVRLDMTLENGTKIEGTVIFSDVSWFDCAKMQLAAWWTRNFN